MGLLLEASIIALTALQSGESCEKVFQETIFLTYPQRRTTQNKEYLDRLATSACKTSNPDTIWKIVNTETNFRFRIVRINKKKKVLQGDAAMNYLTNLKSSGRLENVDIGAMQINHYWHGQSFKKDPIKMLDPSEQVKYLVEDFKPTLKKKCKEKWIGCYHNASNGKRTKLYLKLIAKSKNLLEKNSKTFLDHLPAYKNPFRAMSYLLKNRYGEYGKISYSTDKQRKIIYYRFRNHILFTRKERLYLKPTLSVCLLGCLYALVVLNKAR